MKLMSTIPLYDSLLLSVSCSSLSAECYKHMDYPSQVCEILSCLGMSSPVASLT